MQRELDGFAAFYNDKHQGHKIEWNHALGTASLRASFAAGPKELSVSLYQTIVLLLFNDMEEIPFSDVKLHTGIGWLRCLPAYGFPDRMLESSFIQRTRNYGAHCKVWPAERKRYSRNGQLERT
jgi:Cullin family